MSPVAGPRLRFGARTLRTDRAAVLAVIDLAADSFSGRGGGYVAGAALAAVDRAVDEGADVVNLGGVEAGLGGDAGAARAARDSGDVGDSGDAGVTEDTRRMVSLVATVRERHPELLISVATRRHEVAGPALAAGADILDSPRAGVDPRLAEIAASCAGGVVCSHTGGARPGRVHDAGVARDIADDLVALVAQAEKLVALGVPRESILIDPVRGFGKNTGHRRELLRRCAELVATGWPVLMALSDEDFIGEPLGAGGQDQGEAVLAATAVAAWAGVRVFRTHRVRQTRRVLEMIASIAGTRPPSRAVRGLADITPPSAAADG